MAGFSIRSPGLHSLGVSVLLLLIFLQILWLHFVGVFIESDEVLIGPAIFCQRSLHDELIMCGGRESQSGSIFRKMYILETMLALCFYVPVVLVAFALLSMLLAAHAKDRTMFQCSMACQAASSLLTLGGIFTFLLSFHSYLRLKDMTLWFYLCVAVEGQLVITTVLTRVLREKLTSDWE